MVPVKKCSCCKLEKPIFEFGKRAKSIDNFDYCCKICKRKQAKATYDSRDKKNYNEKKRKYRQSDSYKEKQAKYRYEKYWSDPHLWRKKNRDLYKKNNGKVRLKKWRQDNPAKVSAYKAKRRDRSKSEIFTYLDIIALKTIFANRCFNCNNKGALAIDHHIPLSTGGLLSLDNATLLCKRCNSSKAARNPKDFYSNEKLRVLDWIHAIFSTSEPGPL